MSELPRAVIFTALKVETEAVTTHLHDLHPVRWENDVHQRGRFPDGLGWDVLVVQTGAENQAAALETQAALINFEPAVAIFAGIAGGFEEKGIAALDLVVPPMVAYYQAGRAADSLTLRPRLRGPSSYMTNAAAQIERDGSWLRRLEQAPNDSLTVHLELLASGDHVVKSLDSDTYKLIRTSLDQAVAVDMESSGFLFAASLRPGVQCAVVRGISDLLSDKDLERDASRQPEAARRAAAFTFELLATTPIDRLVISDLPGEPRPWGSAAKPEQRTPQASSSQHPREDDDLAAIAVGLGKELADILDVDHWQSRTENIFFGNPPAVSNDFDERLDHALAWASRRVSIPGLEGVLDAVANLGSVLRDFKDVFHEEVESTLDGRHLRVVQFYRQYEKPLAERERLIIDYGKHTLLIKDLGAELTRAINLVDERIRDLEPSYRVAQGAAGVFAGAEDSFIVVAYTDEERTDPTPYPGLTGFHEVLGSRNASFGPYRDREPWPEELLNELDRAVASNDVPAARQAAFDFASLVADRVPPREPIFVEGGRGGTHTVQFRQVTVRWQSADGLHSGDPVRHLTRTWVTPRGQADTSRERLVGTPDNNAVGEVLNADGSVVLPALRDSDLARFAVEARQILEKLNGEMLA